MGRNVLALPTPSCCPRTGLGPLEQLPRRGGTPSPLGDLPMSSTELRRTALDAVHRALGATMTDFAGWDMPLRYGSERDEHLAVRNRAGLFDLSHMGEITVSGPQARALLDHALVGNIGTVKQGRARYTMICAEDGGILDDLIVYRLGESEYLVVANASNAQTVLDALVERSAGFDAEVRDDRDAYALLAVQGPESVAVLASLTDADLDGLKYYSGLPGPVAGLPALIARAGYAGEDGLALLGKPEHAGGLRRGLTEAWERRGRAPRGAGLPLHGNALSSSLTPLDAGFGRVVKFEKEGDFVGRAALTEAAARAEQNPPRVLVGLVAEGRRVPRSGYPVVRGDEVIGEVTSGAPSPTLGKPIAMAYVDPAHAAPGTAGVAVDIRGRQEPYEVVALPFYKRQK